MLRTESMVKQDDEKEKHPETKFLIERQSALNRHAQRAFVLQQIGSVVAFGVVLLGILLTYFQSLELALVQSVSTIAVSLVTYLFYKQSNRANDNANKFAMIEIKFGETWDILYQAMFNCSAIEDAKSREEAMRKVIDKYLELALSEKIWELKLNLQEAPISEEIEKTTQAIAKKLNQ